MKYSQKASDSIIQKVRLGDYIKRSTRNNHDLRYGIELIEGVNNEGIFSAPKGDPIDVDLKPYKIVNQGAFVYNPSRLNLGSIAYRTDGLCIVSHLYIVFYLNEQGKKQIDPEYLYIYFRRKEFYREVTFRNFGSQRPEFNFNDMSDILIPLPDISVQRKYVDIYKAMVANQQSYERGLEDLKLVCDGYIEDLRRKMPCEKIGKYIELIETTNTDCRYGIEDVRGISIEKEFIETKADMADVNLEPYLLVKPNEFAYVTVTSRNGEKISLALNDSDSTYICSSSYVAFRSKDKTSLLPQYLMLFFSRAEFNRFSRFHSLGSARETFDWSEMCNVQIPIPDIKVQKAIAEIYAIYIMRKRINEQLKAQIKDICPILIKGSLEEAKQ
ncbi:MAG: restriction endonuclease subunit S [Synergistes sp.]|nr:restriction endonuclease subunit S [Synergistes sp.]